MNWITFDTHTAGGPTRTLTNWSDPLPASTVEEKMGHFERQQDHIRKLLMYEPRGHSNMWGAVLVQPSRHESDIAAFFMNCSGYLSTCVHSSIGVVATALLTGLIERPAAGKSLTLETPAGDLGVTPVYEGGSLSHLILQANPAFVVSPIEEADVFGCRVIYSIVYSGVFFAVVDLSTIDHDSIPQTLALDPAVLSGFGRSLLQAINSKPSPRNTYNLQQFSLSLVLFYSRESQYVARDVVVALDGSVDRSPCGAGAGALVALLQSRSELCVGDAMRVESFLGGYFLARVAALTDLGGKAGIIPEIEGGAYLTGKHEFMLDESDPFRTGFLVGSTSLTGDTGIH